MMGKSEEGSLSIASSEANVQLSANRAVARSVPLDKHVGSLGVRHFMTQPNSEQSGPADSDAPRRIRIRIRTRYLLAGAALFVIALFANIGWPTSDGDFVKLSLGAEHSCGLSAEGDIRCWGNNEYYQLEHLDNKYADMDSGSYHTCGIVEDSLRPRLLGE